MQNLTPINPISEVFNIDNMEYMKTIPDKFFDLVIADPPYGINVNMNAGRKSDTKSKKREVKKWDNVAPEQNYFNELNRITKNQIIWGANHFTDKIIKTSSGWIFWDKCVAAGCTFSDGELAWSSFEMTLKKAVIAWSGFIGAEGEKFHPTTKPVKLYKWLLSNYAKQGDKIFDPNMGSQSSRIAAYDMGFDFWGCELDKDYFEQGNKRFENFKKQLKLL
mgnify:CR=1 FL=1